MLRDHLPIGVAAHLKYYIYRLIDPRNGETFYVGKGKEDRLFQHSRGASKFESDEDPQDLKIQRIREILAAGLEVTHVVHRQGIETKELAFEIEASVIDAYPGLANRVGGHGSSDYGTAHIEQLISLYAAEPFVPRENLLVISITKSLEQGIDIYNAVRGVWTVNPKNAEQFRLVLAHDRGRVVGAYRPHLPWLPATKANFPWLTEDILNRWGFTGDLAEPETEQYYLGKRVPDEFRQKGAANPVRYVTKAKA